METSIPFACLSRSSHHVGRGQRAAFLRPLLFLLLRGRPNCTPAGGEWTPLSIEGPTEGGRPAESSGSGRGVTAPQYRSPHKRRVPGSAAEKPHPPWTRGQSGVGALPHRALLRSRENGSQARDPGLGLCSAHEDTQRRELCSGCLSNTILSRSWWIQNSPERADQTYFLGRTATQIKTLPLVDPLL